MATNLWRCEICKHEGPTKTFGRRGNRKCPRCGEADDVFPKRVFECTGCGHTADQDDFFAFYAVGTFGETETAPLDPDPVKDKWKYKCSEHNNERCDSTSYKQVK